MNLQRSRLRKPDDVRAHLYPHLQPVVKRPGNRAERIGLGDFRYDRRGLILLAVSNERDPPGNSVRRGASRYCDRQSGTDRNTKIHCDRLADAAAGCKPYPMSPESLMCSSILKACDFCGLVALILLVPLFARAEDRVSPLVAQLIIGIAPTWNSMNGQLQRFDRTSDGWRAAGSPIAVLFGKSGLAWGRGLINGQEDGPIKVEHDHRAPAGVFRIGTIYTYDKSLPLDANYPFHTVGPGDAWSTIFATTITTSTLRWTQKILQPGSKNKKCAAATSRIAGSLKSGTMPIRRCRDLAVRSFFTFGEDQLDPQPAARPWQKTRWWN